MAMRRATNILRAAVLAAALAPLALAGVDSHSSPSVAGSTPSSAPSSSASSSDSAVVISCGNGIPGGVMCIPTKQDIKDARTAFAQGMKLRERNKLDAAFDKFDEAVRLNPQEVKFLTARELVKGQLVYSHVERGNVLLAEDLRPDAIKEFRAAVELDPEDEFARARLDDADGEIASSQSPALQRGPAASTEIHLEPRYALATFHFSGGVRSLFSEMAAAYGLTVLFDDSVKDRQVRFNIDDADFYTALKLACQLTKTMWAPLSARQMLLAEESAENHRQFDRMSLRTFVLPPHATPQEASDIANLLRNVFELKSVTLGQTSDTVEVKGPQAVLAACARFMQQMDRQKPQVMLEVRIYQIDHQLMRNMGMHIPYTFNLFNIPAAALAGLGGQNIQQLINQLIASGGINQAGSSALSGLLSQLQGQGNGIFSQPLATFGGGLTFEGLSLDQLAATLSLNESWVRSLENMTLRASQGADATFHSGTRFPVENASFAPIFNSPQIAQVIGNQSFVPPFPSISYEDLGLNVKMKPVIHADNSVSLQIELQVRALTGQSTNGIPVISNQEYHGSITLENGEPAVVAGQVSQTETLAMTGLPGLGYFPLLNKVMANNTKQTEANELMIVITPHVVSNYDRDSSEIWISQN
jgi:type II secretory pathway component GspD/PulD (secretin)